MKKKITAVIILLVIASTVVIAAGRGAGSRDNMAGVLESIEISTLSVEEENGILLMREEEKLARDVYMTLYERWGLRTFTNIASAESTHMDSMAILLQRYNLTDPVQSDVVGVFTNPELQGLYNDLTAQGLESLSAALEIGATIEDLDIYDLERLLAKTDNEDITIVYENLLKGSRNHMRAFNMQLTRNGVEYSAQYISDADLRTILGSDMERGRI